VLDVTPDAAAVCPLLVDGEGHPAPQLGNLPPDGEWRPAEPAGDDPVPVRYPRGAALMMRVFLIKAIRQIDEHYGQFGGDADLAAQILKPPRRFCWFLPRTRAMRAAPAIPLPSAPISCSAGPRSRRSITGLAAVCGLAWGRFSALCSLSAWANSELF